MPTKFQLTAYNTCTQRHARNTMDRFCNQKTKPTRQRHCTCFAPTLGLRRRKNCNSTANYLLRHWANRKTHFWAAHWSLWDLRLPGDMDKTEARWFTHIYSLRKHKRHNKDSEQPRFQNTRLLLPQKQQIFLPAAALRSQNSHTCFLLLKKDPSGWPQGASHAQQGSKQHSGTILRHACATYRN